MNRSAVICFVNFEATRALKLIFHSIKLNISVKDFLSKCE